MGLQVKVMEKGRRETERNSRFLAVITGREDWLGAVARNDSVSTLFYFARDDTSLHYLIREQLRGSREFAGM